MIEEIPTRKEVNDANRATKQAVFVQELRARGIVRDACLVAGIERSRIYQWRKEDADFAREWDAAYEDAADNLEREAFRRAVEGTREPVFYEGEVCGYITRYSDSLLIALLKAAKPEKYRERIEHAGTVDFNLTERIYAGRKRAGIGEVLRLRPTDTPAA